MSYERRYRERVLRYVAQGHTYAETQEVYGVSASAIKQWRKLLAQTGDLKDALPNRHFRKIDPDKLRQYVQDHPDAYLREIAEVFGCSIAGIDKTLRKLRITRKKRHPSTANGTKKSGQHTRIL